MVHNISAGLTVVYNSSYTGIIKKEKKTRERKKEACFLSKLTMLIAASEWNQWPITDFLPEIFAYTTGKLTWQNRSACHIIGEC